MCLFSATFFTSLAGVILRHVEAADGWQVLFYRSIAFVAVLLAFLAWRHGAGTVRAFRAVGRPGLVVALALSPAFILFILALLETTVANVVFILSLSPFFAALFAWLGLGEPVGRSTLAAMVVSLIGVGFMVGDGLVAGTLLGNAFALGACLSYSLALVAMRKGRAVDMLPAVCLAGVVAIAVSGALAVAVSPGALAVRAHDLALAAVLGVVQLAFQYILVTTGTRYVPVAEVALIGRLVLVLAPLWVWLAVDEVPGALTLIGGAIILAAVMGHGLLALRQARAGGARSQARAGGARRRI
ncbi:MAG: DMT family transporter [Kiloniellales bacterium]|nr:DMT family transporter [Kiloniellales bacterium]